MNAALLLQRTVRPTATIHLERGGAHWLEVELGRVRASWQRPQASALAAALIEVPPATAEVLLGAFAPGFSAGELPALLTALLAFDEEMVAEDHRADRVGPRSHKAARLVRL